jgi:two-component system, chemotaxis family, protein-glutamate methylesterase/glutaminase
MKRDVIVIGASAGGIEPLKTLVAALPSDLPAAIFIVQHIPPWQRSQLPEILTHAGNLPAFHPAPDEEIRNGRIYVAPPDRHVIMESGGKIALWHGPKENRFRPAINPLFRSAAVMYGKRVAGVILSGALDDGAAGLWWVKRFGGIGAVQEPEEALFPDMPRNAMEHSTVDYVLPVSKLGPALTRLARGIAPAEIFQGREENDRDDGKHGSDQRYVS